MLPTKLKRIRFHNLAECGVLIINDKTLKRALLAVQANDPCHCDICQVAARKLGE